jgi:hypothetical protein
MQRTHSSQGHYLRNLQQPSRLLLLRVGIEFELREYESVIENITFRIVQQLYSTFYSISVVARCEFISTLNCSVIRVFRIKRQVIRNEVVFIEVIYHLGLILCVPNVCNKIPLPHQNTVKSLSAQISEIKSSSSSGS